MCGRRLASFRGFKADGTRNTNTADPLLPAVLVQKENGDVDWTDRPQYTPPEQEISVANTAEAADLTNYVDFISGKDEDGNEKALVGTEDESEGNWRMVWVPSVQKWTTVPDIEPDFPDLCTTLAADTVIDSVSENFVLRVESTSHLAVGVSVMINGYELAVTEVIDEEYVRVELVDTIASPAVLEDGETVCNIGFRPCPRGTEAYADNMVGCLNDTPVYVETPEDVNEVAVPGLWWRNQLGRVGFVPAPVDPVTGLVVPNLIFKTDGAPVAGQANLPGFVAQTTGYTWITPAAAFTQAGTGPTTGTFNFDVSGVTGYPAGAAVAIFDVKLIASTQNSYYAALVTLNGLNAAAVRLAVLWESGTSIAQIQVPIHNSTVVAMVVSKLFGGVGNNTWNLDVNVVGFIG